MPAAVNAGAKLTGTYDCSPNVSIGGRLFNNFESRGYGLIDLHRALVVSCDTVFYRLAYAAWLAQGGLAAPVTAPDPFVAMAKAFGLGRRTGIDMPGEAAGRVPDRAWKEEYWLATRDATCKRARTGYPDVARTDRARAAYLLRLATENCSAGYQYRAGDAVNFSIGQGDTAVTLLQMAGVYAAIANGGTLWQPQVAAAFRAPDGATTTIAPKRVGTVPLRRDVLAYVRAALGDVTQTRRLGRNGLRRLPAGPLPGRRQDGHRRGLRQAGDRVVRRLRADDEAEVRRRGRRRAGRVGLEGRGPCRAPDLRCHPCPGSVGAA